MVLVQQPALAQPAALLPAPPLHNKQAQELAQVPEQGSKLVQEQGSKRVLAQEQALQACIQVPVPALQACSSTPSCGI